MVEFIVTHMMKDFPMDLYLWEHMHITHTHIIIVSYRTSFSFVNHSFVFISCAGAVCRSSTNSCATRRNAESDYTTPGESSGQVKIPPFLSFQICRNWLLSFSKLKRHQQSNEYVSIVMVDVDSHTYLWDLCKQCKINRVLEDLSQDVFIT